MCPLACIARALWARFASEHLARALCLDLVTDEYVDEIKNVMRQHGEDLLNQTEERAA